MNARYRCNECGHGFFSDEPDADDVTCENRECGSADVDIDPEWLHAHRRRLARDNAVENLMSARSS